VNEKEARLVLNEILAKLNQNEKFIGIGAIVFLVGWLLGMVLASVSYGAGTLYSVSENVFSSSGGSGIGFLGVIGAIAAIVVIYLRHAPTMNITWPAPVEIIQLAIAGVVALVALDLLWNNFTNSQNWNNAFGGLGAIGAANIPGWPITDYIAVLGVVVGAGVMVYGAYLEYSASKKTA
jgi:hypothetical protein